MCYYVGTFAFLFVIRGRNRFLHGLKSSLSSSSPSSCRLSSLSLITMKIITINNKQLLIPLLLVAVVLSWQVAAVLH
uniref:Uncharacterized protein n=1 Tax=Amphimedon queenslandica TaxID=400682 RepID=A0A1X7UFH1_AMPQE